MKRKAFMTLSSKVYNKKSADDLANTGLKLFDDDGNDLPDDEDLDDDAVAAAVTKLDAEKITGIKKTVGDATFKKAEAQTSKQFEKKLREAFEIEDSSLIGDALVEHIKDNLPEGAIPADITKLTPDEVAKIPAVKTIIQQHKKAVNDLTKKHTDELEAERGKQSQAELISEVLRKAEGRLNREGFKVNLPEDAAKREARLEKLFRSELKGVIWKKEANGDIIPVDADGVQLADSNDNPYTFDSYVDNVADLNLDFVKADAIPPAGPNNKNQQQQQQKAKGASYTGRKPQNQKDYLELMTGDEIDDDSKNALANDYREHSW